MYHNYHDHQVKCVFWQFSVVLFRKNRVSLGNMCTLEMGMAYC